MSIFTYDATLDVRLPRASAAPAPATDVTPAASLASKANATGALRHDPSALSPATPTIPSALLKAPSPRAQQSCLSDVLVPSTQFSRSPASVVFATKLAQWRGLTRAGWMKARKSG